MTVSVVIAQIVVLLLACFSPVALVAAVIPGRGHALFKTWATQMATHLVRKAAYSLILAVLLAVLSALQGATSDLGWLMSFGLQAALMWTVFLKRHALSGQLVAAVTGEHPEREASLKRLLGLAYTARAISPARRPASTPRPSPTSRAAPVSPAAAPVLVETGAAPVPASAPDAGEPTTVRSTATHRPTPTEGPRDREPTATVETGARRGERPGHRRGRSEREPRTDRVETPLERRTAAAPPATRRTPPEEPPASGPPPARRPGAPAPAPGRAPAQRPAGRPSPADLERDRIPGQPSPPEPASDDRDSGRDR